MWSFFLKALKTKAQKIIRVIRSNPSQKAETWCHRAVNDLFWVTQLVGSH